MEDLKFTALDTETFHGKAFLLSTPEKVYQLKGFMHFVEIAAKLGSRFTFFNLEYDVSALLKYLPQGVVEQVYLDKSVFYRDISLRYLAGKYFKISGAGFCLHFYDIFPFFQTSLDKASKKFLGIGKKEMSKKWLAQLSPQFYQKHKAEIDAYAIQDAKLTQGLTDLICQALQESGIGVEHLYSPGYIAKCYLKQKGVIMKDVPDKYLDFVRAGYFGARIEVVKKGYFKKAEVYDIKSAYPFALSQLPNFSDARYSKDKVIKSDWYFVKAKVWSNPAACHLLPKRTSQGLIIFPQFTGQTTTMTNFEYEYLTKNNLAKVEIVEVLNIWKKNEKPFAKIIAELFARRKESTGKSILFKLILNSLYGIFAEKIVEYNKVGIVRAYFQIMKESERASRQLLIAQAKRYCQFAERYWEKECDCGYCRILRKHMRRRNFNDKPLLQNGDLYYSKTVKAGRMTNIAMAAMITALIRVRIFDLQRKAGNKFIACFTDSVICEPTDKFKTGENLGDLEKKYDTDLIMIGSGVYETKEESKTRGFRLSGKNTLRYLLKLAKNRKRKTISIPQNVRVSAGIMIRRPLVRYSDFNEIQPKEKNLDLNFDQKRKWENVFKNAADVFKKIIVSSPIILIDKKRKK